VATSLARASLVSDVIDCIDDHEIRSDARCGPIAEEALESTRLVETLADRMVDRKEPRKATVLLQVALRKFPSNESLENRLKIARSYAEEADAIRILDRARKANPAGDETEAQMTRIRCTRMSGDAGLKACDQALARQPDDPALLAAKADLLAADGRVAEAIAALTTLQRLRPNELIVRQKIALLVGPNNRPPAVASLPVPQAVTPTASPFAAAPPGTVAVPPTTLPGARPPSGLAAGPTATAPGKPTQTRVAEAELNQRLAMLQRLRDNGTLQESEFFARRQTLLDAYLSPLSAPPPTGAVSAATGAVVAAPAINFGTYHALIIGIDRYRYLPQLQTTHNDAKALADLLKDKYDYKVRLLLDPTRAQIIEALDDLRETLTEKDNLLIYYAGHGWLDKEADQGFWLPADARAERRSQWISNDTVRDLAKALKVKHMLVIADSCFSGTLTRGIDIVVERLDADYLKRISSKKARQAMSSGGLEPVLDSVDGQHSPFARALVRILAENRSVLDGTTLFRDIRRPVSLSADQTPEFSDIRRAGHDGGDFLFVRRR
jgi:tetratricopeptide (TPR) repeat protein